MDELVGHYEKSEVHFTEVRTDLGKVETELETACGRSVKVRDKVEALERHIRMLVVSRTTMGNTIDRMREEMDGLLLVNQRMVNAIVQLRVGQVHNQDNLIVIDNNSSSSEGTIAEVSDVLEHSVLFRLRTK